MSEEKGPFATADGHVKFETELWGLSIAEWTIIVNNKIARAEDWNTRPLVPGDFGYDVLASQIEAILQNMETAIANYNTNGIFLEQSISRKNYANVAHNAWVRNYTYWRDNKPWISSFSSPSYNAPFQPLGDYMQETRAKAANVDEITPSQRARINVIVENLLDAITEIAYEGYEDPSSASGEAW